MTVQKTLFAEIFTLWPDIASLAKDMGVPSTRGHQWIRRNYLPLWYWPRLIDVAEQRFGRVLTYRQLVEATVAMRGEAYIAGQAQGAETRRRNREGDGRSEAA